MELAYPTPNNEARVFDPEKKKRKRDGYEEGDWTQFKEIPVTDFINTTDPIAILGQYNKLSFQQPLNGDIALSTINRLEETTEEIRKCCEDLKVLGKKEFRNLLRWRLKVREKFGLVVKKGGQAKKDEPEEVAEIAPMDEELAIQEELQRLREKESSKSKKERRKENEKKRKEIVRMQMHMTTPMDIGMEQIGPLGDDAPFSLKRVEREGARDTIAAGKEVTIESESEDSESDDDAESDDEGDRLERELDSLYEQYQDRKEDKDTKLRAKKARKDFEADEWEGFSESGNEESDNEDSEFGTANGVAPPKNGTLSNNAALFFDQDIFQGLEDVDDVEDEDEDENEDSVIEMDEDDNDYTESKNSVSKKQKAKDAKAGTQMVLDSSDEEPEELDEPRKENGQLGECC